MPTREVRDWARILKKEWSARARSPRSRFYIASHPGWSEEESWTRQAAIDASFVLTGLDADALRTMAVLEIGCGNGRLIDQVASRVASYSGFDICAPYVAEARETHRALDQVRVHEGDGARVPDPLRDRRYDLIFAAAVFIHCPYPVIRSYLEDGLALLAPGGRFRFQVLADPDDPEGYVPMEALAPRAEDRSRSIFDEVVAEQEEARETELVEDSHYEGHHFRHRDFLALAAEVAPPTARTHVIRFDPLLLNCEIGLP